MLTGENDQGESQDQVEVEPEETSTVETPEVEQQSSEDGNPAWADIREKLDPVSFQQIREDLEKWDSGVNQKFQSIHDSYKPWKEFQDSGVTPETVGQWQNVIERMDQDPEAIYTALGTFLEENGRMPKQEELAEQVEDDAEELDPVQAELKELREQQKQFFDAQTEQAQEQENQKMRQQAETDLTDEISQLKETHKDFTDEDIREVLMRASYVAQQNAADGNNKTPALSEIADGYIELQNRIRSVPRPGDSAPRLVPTSGGNPANATPGKTLGQLSSQETQNLMVEYLEKNKV